MTKIDIRRSNKYSNCGFLLHLKFIKIFRRKKLHKAIDELTSEDTEKMKLQAIRNALHRAVDMGLYDNNIKDFTKGFTEIDKESK